MIRLSLRLEFAHSVDMNENANQRGGGTSPRNVSPLNSPRKEGVPVPQQNYGRTAESRTKQPSISNSSTASTTTTVHRYSDVSSDSEVSSDPGEAGGYYSPRQGHSRGRKMDFVDRDREREKERTSYVTTRDTSLSPRGYSSPRSSNEDAVASAYGTNNTQNDHRAASVSEDSELSKQQQIKRQLVYRVTTFHHEMNQLPRGKYQTLVGLTFTALDLLQQNATLGTRLSTRLKV